jgi:hypothetical protein
MQKPKTHFEQIPVAVAKKIAEEECENKISKNHVVVETPVRKTEAKCMSAPQETI